MGYLQVTKEGHSGNVCNNIQPETEMVICNMLGYNFSRYVTG